MKWSEVRRKAEEDGWVLVRFGRNHDLYEKKRQTAAHRAPFICRSERKGLIQNKETVKFEIV